jgi:hypothetical protein
MRSDIDTAITDVLVAADASRSRRQLERAGNFRDRCLLCVAHRNPAHAKKSALVGGFGHVLADFT